ncbi:MAG: hypothetical protein ACLFQA_12325 [Bacteroidales bacterium]
MIPKKAIAGLLALLIFVLVLVLIMNVSLNYSISSQGILYPGEEWTLERTPDGYLINSLKDNYNNSISDYTVTEFQRGDLARFILAPGIKEKEIINKGDTIGHISSQNEIRKKIELLGELEKQRVLLSVYASGERIEEVNIAYEMMILAKQTYEAQDRINERNRKLSERGHISEEEYEISETEYNKARQNYLIAQSEYQAMLSGAKQEQLEYVQASIAALEQQIDHIDELINSLIITSPIRGRIIRQQGTSGINETIVRIAGLSDYILIVPVDVHNRSWLEVGQQVNFQPHAGTDSYRGSISRFDNSAQILNGRQKVFVTAKVEHPGSDHNFYPNMLVEVNIPSKPLSLLEYISRLINEVYHN